MSERKWGLFLMDILERIDRVKSYVAGFTYEEFLQDSKTQDAVVRNLEVIGEAARLIPEDIRQRHSEIPWPQMIALRNRLIHGYFVVDYEIVWDIVTNELPPLRKHLEEILEESGS